jgi:hypothetical protein
LLFPCFHPLFALMDILQKPHEFLINQRVQSVL